MSLHDLYLISPQLAMAGLGILVILLDLTIDRKERLAAVAFIGLAAPLAFTLAQLFQLTGLVGGTVIDNLTPQSSVLAKSLAVDQLGLFFSLLVITASGLVILGCADYVKRMPRMQGEFYGLMLLSASGMMLLVSGVELITIYVALELTTLPMVALAAFLFTPRSGEAGMKFLIVGAISSALTLYGMAWIFGFAGSVHLEEIAQAVRTGTGADSNLPFGSYAIMVGLALITVGIAFKLSAVPSQMWTPDIYEGASIPMVAFLSVASKAAAFALLLRLVYIGFPDLAGEWGLLLAILAAASMVAGNLAAIVQSNIRRLFGYSAIAHAGYILVGVAAVTPAGRGADGSIVFATLGPSSVLFYLVAYTAANLTAFFAIIAIGRLTGSNRIEDLAGLFRRSPFLAVALALALLALIGVPPTGIFFAKFYVFMAAMQSGLAWLAVVGVINSVVSAYYYIRIIRVMFLPSANQSSASRRGISQESAFAAERESEAREGELLGDGGSSRVASLAILLTSIGIALMGIAPGPLLKVAESAVAALSGTVIR